MGLHGVELTLLWVMPDIGLLQARRNALAQNASRLAVLRKLHEMVASELENPAERSAQQLLLRAQRNISLWEQNHTCSSEYVAQWRGLLEDQPANRIRSFLDSGNANALMQNSPFGFLLSKMGASD